MITTPCTPSPCGPNSQCRENNGQAVCSCVSGFIGSPPTCRPECVVSTDCSLNQACINQKCQNSCEGGCGIGADCVVINHNPVCSCRPQFTGDPFTRCVSTRKFLSFMVYNVKFLDSKLTFDAISAPTPPAPTNPCQPSPCGPNSQCQVVNGLPSCSCLENFILSPPNCRPECTSNSDCQSQMACINMRCRDPCIDSCGVDAECRVVSNIPNCFCPPGFTGDPFTQCVPQTRKISLSLFLHYNFFLVLSN